MKNALVALDYQGLTVSFNEDGWFNATAAAAHYGKRVEHYFANDETKEYIKELCNADNTQNSGYSGCYIVARKGKNGGTWLHPDLGVHFARWLDVRFSIWCDRQIRALLAGQHPHFDWKRTRHEAASTFKVMNDILAAVRADQGKATAAHHYMNEARLVNWALAGEFKGLDRDALPVHELNLLAQLELKNATLIGRNAAYPDRKKILESTALESRVIPFPSLLPPSTDKAA